MNFLTGFFKGITNCFKGFSLIFEKGLWPYLLYPIIIWLALWFGSFWLFSSVASWFSEYLNTYLNFENIPDSGSWLSFAKPFLTGYFSLVITWILTIFFWLVSSVFIKYMVLIIMSPLFALLSESVEQKLKGTSYPFSFFQLIKDTRRGIAVSIRNMLLEYMFIFLCFIITLVFPPLAIFSGPAIILISCYFLGFTMLDYNFERYKMSISQSVQFARKNIGLACGIGMVYSCFMLLPFYIGISMGPVLAVIGATISFLELKQKETPTVV